MATEALVPIPHGPLSGTLDFSFDSVSEQLFKRMENCVYDMRTGQLGVLRSTKDAYAVFAPPDKDKNGGKPSIQVCPVTAFGLPIPAYAIRTKIDQLQPGDVVNVSGANAETWLYFLKTDEGAELDEISNTCLHGIRVEDGVKVVVTISDSLFVERDSVLCVKNAIGQQTQFSRMLPMLAMMGAGGKGEEGKDKLSKLILCMLMGQGSDPSGQGMDVKSLLPLMMLSGGGENLGMAMLMMTGGLLGGCRS